MSVLVHTVPIQLDRERHLRLDFNAARHYKRATGKSLFDAEIWNSVDVEEVVTMVWAMLIHEDKELSVDDVGAMIHPGNSAHVFECLLKSYTANTSEATEGQPTARPPVTVPQT